MTSLGPPAVEMTSKTSSSKSLNPSVQSVQWEVLPEHTVTGDSAGVESLREFPAVLAGGHYSNLQMGQLPPTRASV